MKKLSIADTVSLISIAGAGIVCVSLAYEQGFASGAGLSLIDLSLSPQDFVKSAAAWAPSLVLGFVGIFALEAITSVIEGGRSEEELIQSTSKPKLWRKIRRSPDYLFLALGLILFVALLGKVSFIQPFAPQAYSVVWLSLAGFLVTRNSLKRKFPPRLLFSIWAIVGVVLFVYGGGKQDAIVASNKKVMDEVEFTTGAVYSGRIVRRYSDFVLLIPAGERDTVIIPSAEVRKIRRANPGVRGNAGSVSKQSP